MRIIRQCQYCGRPLTEYSTLTVLWSYLIAGNHPRRGWFEGYCSGGCLARDRIIRNPIKPFIISIGLILVAFVIFSFVEFYYPENIFLAGPPRVRAMDLLVFWIIGTIIGIYGFFSLLVNIYCFFSENLKTRHEKIPSIEQKVKEVEYDLETAKKEMDAGNYKDAISKLNSLKDSLLLTPEGKKRMRSLLALCHFQLEDYPNAYYNIKQLKKKSQLTVKDYIIKIQCETLLDLPQQRQKTLMEALESFPDHPKLKVLIQKEDK